MCVLVKGLDTSRSEWEPGIRGFCPLCGEWEAILMSGLCLDCELAGLMFKATKRAYELLRKSYIEATA